jgi:hypothetical protein
MALFGKKFRQLTAQALAADPAEMRALRQRILPPRGGRAAPVLRLETEADYRDAPLAIVSAFHADELTGDRADKLLDQVESAMDRRQAESARANADWKKWDANFLRGMVEGERMWGREPPAEFVRQVNADLIAMGEEPVPVRCGAAGEGAELVNNNENTSARRYATMEEREEAYRQFPHLAPKERLARLRAAQQEQQTNDRETGS